MTQYAEEVSNYTLVVKVEYADPAGGFGGWFLHSIHQLSDYGLGGGSQTDFPTYSRSSTNPSAIQLRATITARLEKMFGTACSVTYTMTIVQGVTPAVIDVDF